jgi:hypothetical protein
VEAGLLSSLSRLHTIQQLIIQLYQSKVAAQATCSILQVPWFGSTQLQRHDAQVSDKRKYTKQ